MTHPLSRPLALLLGFFVLSRSVNAADADPPLIPPAKALERITVPAGFRTSLVVGEPDMVKPIAMTTDDKGRLWVVESHSYPHWIRDDKPGRDRILIYEQQTDGTWKGKVFLDNGRNLSGIAVGFGGVWLCATPEFIFIPVKPGEDKPAGPARVLLDGWSLDARHNVFNGLSWGPDGWLYGLNGIIDRARVGKPGTPADKRTWVDCGVWRFHPIREEFEFVAWGTTNPWGIDFDEYGEMFITNCVIKHIFHVIPGAHYRRMYGQDLNTSTYSLMESCADHIHWGGGDWTTSRGGTGAHSVAGGGHAHAGCLIYQGGAWPAEYRNHALMCNLHGARVNQDVLERSGSGYTAKHGNDLLLAHDPWFRGLGLQAAADGGVFISDWHDTGECHNYDKVQPCGRIYKLDYGKSERVQTDLTKLSDAQLVALQTNKNDWWVRTSRRLLQERAHAGKLDSAVKPALEKLLHDSKSESDQLRALWALFALDQISEDGLVKLLDDSGERIRGWAVRLLVDRKPPSDKVIKKFAELAREDKSPMVRLALASALQRLEAGRRWDVAMALAAHAEDTTDANLPLMIWYGIESAVPAQPDRAAELIRAARIPLIRQYTARRLAAMAE
jgi:putative membrane-bound dehydrogenase-like protein